MLVEVRVRVRERLHAEAPLHLLYLEDKQVEVSHPEDKWDDLRRVFAVTQQEVDVAPEVITCTIKVFDSDAYVLIDPGATHSFISTKFIAQVNIEIHPIDCSMVVSLPT